MKKVDLQTSLKKRGLDFGRLAALAGIGHAHLSQVINNMPGRATTRSPIYSCTSRMRRSGRWVARKNFRLGKKAQPEKLETSSTENNVPIPAEGVTP